MPVVGPAPAVVGLVLHHLLYNAREPNIGGLRVGGPALQQLPPHRLGADRNEKRGGGPLANAETGEGFDSRV